MELGPELVIMDGGSELVKSIGAEMNVEVG